MNPSFGRPPYIRVWPPLMRAVHTLMNTDFGSAPSSVGGSEIEIAMLIGAGVNFR